MRVRIWEQCSLGLRACVLALLAASSAPGEPFDLNQVPWSARLYNYDVSGGFAFLPAIDAATMEPVRFAFASNSRGDPESLDGSLYDPGTLSAVYGRYSGVIGSGAFGFVVFVEPRPFEPPFEISLPGYWTGPIFEPGEAPEWDPDNPPFPVEIFFDEETPGLEEELLPDDPEALPDEVILAARAFPEYLGAGDASDPVVLLDGQLDLTTPEPSTFVLVGGGILLAGWLSRRKPGRRER